MCVCVAKTKRDTRNPYMMLYRYEQHTKQNKQCEHSVGLLDLTLQADIMQSMSYSVFESGTSLNQYTYNNVIFLVLCFFLFFASQTQKNKCIKITQKKGTDNNQSLYYKITSAYYTATGGSRTQIALSIELFGIGNDIAQSALDFTTLTNVNL